MALRTCQNLTFIPLVWKLLHNSVNIYKGVYLLVKVNSYLKEVKGIPLIESECAPYSPYAFTYIQKQLEIASQELVRTFYIVLGKLPYKWISQL